MKTENLALLGAVTAIILATSCVAQVLVRNGAPPVEAQAGGLGLLALGLLALVLATPLHVVALLIIGAVLAGAGHGLAFLAAQEIGLRHTRARKNEIDAAESAEHIPLRYFLAFVGPVLVTTRDFLAHAGHSAEEVDRMHAARTKTVLLHMTLGTPAVRAGRRLVTEEAG